MIKKIRGTILLSFAISMSVCGQTGHKDSRIMQDSVIIDEIVVSADRNQILRKNAPSLINIIDRNLLEQVNASCLAQGLSFQPGVRVEYGCQNCGMIQARINGLDGNYTQILINSRPVFSSLNGVYGIEQISPNMIDRVEVVRGGGSAQYGASAVGGTINVITRIPQDTHISASHQISSIGGTHSLDNQTMIDASHTTKDNKAGIALFAQRRKRDPYDNDHDGYSEITRLETQSMGVNLFLRSGEHSKLNLNYYNINDERRGGNLLDLPPHEANIAEQTSHHINGGEISYELYSNSLADKLEIYSATQGTLRDSYYGGIGEGTPEDIENAEKAYGKTKEWSIIGGMKYMHMFKKFIFWPSILTCGVEYHHDNMKDNALGYNEIRKQTLNIESSYLQNEWKNTNWTFLLGSRIDKHNLIDHVIFSPRIDVRYAPTDHFVFRCNYAEGFRAPQIFDEDLHVSLVGGERIQTRLAEGLKEERSRSVSLSSDFQTNIGTKSIDILLEGFHTHLINSFADRYLTDTCSDGVTYLERYNGSGATVEGFNIECKSILSNTIILQCGWTVQRSRYHEAETWSETAPAERRIFHAPDTYGYIMCDGKILNNLDITLSGTYTGKMKVQHSAGSGVTEDIAVYTPSFYDLGLKLNYSIRINSSFGVQLNVGVQNIFNSYQNDFDKGYDRDSNYIYGPGLPRTYTGGIKILL